jgi:hypothetical protein
VDIPKRTVSFLGDSTDWRLITAKELAELEARKPQVPAEVIAEARRWAQNLRMWPRTATLTEDGFRLIPEDCLRVCSAAFDALLAAVEAAPDEERLTEEECWVKLREAITQAAQAHGDSPGNLIVEWSGRDWVATFEAGSSSRGIGRHATDPIAACRELASQAIPSPTPDVADMTLDEQIDELATYMPEQMPVLALLLDETTLPKVLQSFRDRECGS